MSSHQASSGSEPGEHRPEQVRPAHDRQGGFWQVRPSFVHSLLAAAGHWGARKVTIVATELGLTTIGVVSIRSVELSVALPGAIVALTLLFVFGLVALRTKSTG